jgi:hypothetical protein
MTGEPAKARPINVDLRVDPETGSRIVTMWERPDDYVIITASRQASDSLIDAAARIAKNDKGDDK